MAGIDPFSSATELLAALRGGRVTSGELTDLYIRLVSMGVIRDLRIVF